VVDDFWTQGQEYSSFTEALAVGIRDIIVDKATAVTPGEAYILWFELQEYIAAIDADNEYSALFDDDLSAESGGDTAVFGIRQAVDSASPLDVDLSIGGQPTTIIERQGAAPIGDTNMDAPVNLNSWVAKPATGRPSHGYFNFTGENPFISICCDGDTAGQTVNVASSNNTLASDLTLTAGADQNISLNIKNPISAGAESRRYATEDLLANNDSLNFSDDQGEFNLTDIPPPPPEHAPSDFIIDFFNAADLDETGAQDLYQNFPERYLDRWRSFLADSLLRYESLESPRQTFDFIQGVIDYYTQGIDVTPGVIDPAFIPDAGGDKEEFEGGANVSPIEPNDQYSGAGIPLDNNFESPQYGPGPIWGQGRNYSGRPLDTSIDDITDTSADELKARVDDIGTHVFDGPDIGTTLDPVGAPTESR